MVVTEAAQMARYPIAIDLSVSRRNCEQLAPHMFLGGTGFRREDVRCLGAHDGIEWKRDCLKGEDICPCSTEHEKDLRPLAKVRPQLLHRSRGVRVVPV